MQNPRNDRRFLTLQGGTMIGLSVAIIGLHIFQIVWVFTSGLRGWWKYAIPVFSGGHLVSVIVMSAMYMNEITRIFWVAIIIHLYGFLVLLISSAILFYYVYRIYLLISTAIGILMIIIHFVCIEPLLSGANITVITTIQQPTLSLHPSTGPPSVEVQNRLQIDKAARVRTAAARLEHYLEVGNY